MLWVTTEHQQSRAALAGGALAELLEGMGRGWLEALQGRLPVLWQCGRGKPRALQNSTALRRQGLRTEMALGKTGQAGGTQPVLQTQVAATCQPINLPLLPQSSHPPQKARETHSGPTREGNQCHARHQDHLLSTTHVKFSYGLLIISNRSPVICSNTQGPCERVPIVLK